MVYFKKTKDFLVGTHKIEAIVSIPSSFEPLLQESKINLLAKSCENNFLDGFLEAIILTLQHNRDLVNSDKKITIEFRDLGENLQSAKAGLASTRESTAEHFYLMGSFKGWFNYYVHYLQRNQESEFLKVAFTMLVHEFAHCNDAHPYSIHNSVEKFRQDREKSFLMYLAWNIESQRSEGLAVIRQAHALTEQGYHYQFHHDLRDRTISMQKPADFEDKEWVAFWKHTFPMGLTNVRNMVIEYRARSENFLKSFHLNKGRYETSEIKGFAFNYAYKYASYNYTLGTMMCYFIFIHRLSDSQLDIIDFDLRTRIRRNEVAAKYVQGHNLALGRIEYTKFGEILALLLKMDIFEFYEMYDKACSALGIPEEFRLIKPKYRDELYARKSEILSWVK